MKNELECSVCNAPMDEDEGVIGEFGILPVQFCCWCTASLTDMVIQMQGLDDIDLLQERIDNIKENS